MKRMLWLIAFAAALAGCNSGGSDTTTVTGADGSKVTVGKDGATITGTDEKGNTTSVTSKDGQVDMKSDSGASATWNEKGGAATDEKGNKSSWSVQGPTEEDLGVPFYPGSQATDSPGLSTTANGKTTHMSNRVTDDSSDKVIEFYRGKIATVEATVNTPEAGTAMMSGKLADGGTFTLTCAKDDKGKTGISIAILREKKE